jgi:hypothetical protein
MGRTAHCAARASQEECAPAEPWRCGSGLLPWEARWVWPAGDCHSSALPSLLFEEHAEGCPARRSMHQIQQVASTRLPRLMAQSCRTAGPDSRARQSRLPTRVVRSSRLPRLSATLARGCEAFGRGRVREEQQVEEARRIEVGEVRLGESAEGGLVGCLVAGQLERVAVGGALPATGDGR